MLQLFLRLHEGITKPLATMQEKNKSLIDMQANSMAEVPTRYEHMQVDFAYLHACICNKSGTKTCACQARSGCFAKGVCGCYKSRLRDESVPGPCKVMASNNY